MKANCCTSPDEFLALLAKIAQSSRVKYSPNTIRRAWEYAATCHREQNRLSGEAYITHPSQTALIIASMGIDETSIIAALLHDTIEDSKTANPGELERLFGQDVLRIVEGVTKIQRLKTSQSPNEASAENMRKLLLAMAQDIRVIFVKLADRLHNMRTLGWQSSEKRDQIARETLQIYAPLANRLGISWIKTELEDLALKHLEPEAYQKLKSEIETTKLERDKRLEWIMGEIQNELEKYGIRAQLKGRVKHFYSIYRKMLTKNKPFSEIHDLLAVRIICRDIPECYQILGIIHSLYRPLYDRFKDYIALPKSNMYSSLHTTILGPDGQQLEIQIRTQEMDSIAEEGVASHLLYKANQTGEKREMVTTLPWLIKLKNWQDSLNDPGHFMQELTGEMLQDEIYVFTPRGDVIRLVADASPIDFAYAIHTDIGEHTIGARVNGKMVPLKTRLKNCDVVEILTSRSAHPTPAWLRIVRSSKARQRIRAWLRNVSSENAPSPAQPDEHPPKRQPPKPPSSQGSLEPLGSQAIVLAGEKNLLIEFGRCCNPQVGEPIIGYLSRGRGVIIHRHDCPNLPWLLREQERIVYPSWKYQERLLVTKLLLEAPNEPELLPDLASLILVNNGGIRAFRHLESNTTTAKIELEIEHSTPAALNLIKEAIVANEHYRIVADST